MTQAWQEGQHNIVHRNSYKIDKTLITLRMVDVTVGLAINTDMMLSELQKNLEQAKLESAARSQIELAKPCLENNVRRVKELMEAGANIPHG